MYDIKTMIERTFSSDTKEDRNQWIALIERVKAKKEFKVTHFQKSGLDKRHNPWPSLLFKP